MIYWLVVLTLWVLSIFLLAFGGALLFQYLTGQLSQGKLLLAAGAFALGLLFNFLVVNWPVEATKRGIDEKTLKALKLMAKAAPLAPKAVREGLLKIIEKYS